MLTEKEFEEKLRTLEMKLPSLTADMLFRGRHPSPFVGSGYKTSGIAEYDPAIHDISDIDFELSAQEPDKRLLVRLYYDEEVRPTYIVIDTTETMFFGDKVDSALLSAWCLSSIFIIDGPVRFIDWMDLADPLARQSDLLPEHLRLSLKGWRKEHEERAKELAGEIFSARTKILKRKSKTPQASTEDLRNLLKRDTTKANLVLVSDFIMPGEYSKVFRDLRAAEFMLFAIAIRDMAEEKIPDIGGIDVFDTESGTSFLLSGSSDRQKRIAEEKIAAHLGEFETQCRNSAVLFTKITNPDNIIVSIHLLLQKIQRM